MKSNHKSILFFTTLACVVLSSPSQSLSSSTTLTASDRKRLEAVLEPGWQLTDLNLVTYAASGYKHLGLKVPNSEAACSYVSGQAADTNANTEMLFLAASAAVYLGCPITASPHMKQTLTESISESSSLVEVYHAVLGLHRLKENIDTAKVLAVTQAILKKDDGVLNLGYAFHIGSVLSGDVSSLHSRIEDAVVQADEVDGRMLQFEGGLSITALVVDGAYKLSEAAKRPVPLRPEQAVKFANYLLSRKSVQLPKGVHYLLHALTMFTNNKYHVPVAISLASSVAVSAAQPSVQVSISDLMGNNIPGADVRVTAEQVTRDDDGQVLASSLQLTAVKDSKTLYELDAMALQPKRGFHQLSVTAAASDKRLVGNTKALLKFKVLTSISLERVEVGTADADQSSAPTLKEVVYGSKLAGGPLEADRHQKVLVRFQVKDTTSGKPTRVHQAFVRITHSSSKREIIFKADPEPSSVLYKFEMVVSASQPQFKGVSGLYSMELIIGDACISNPLRWNLADLNLNFPATKPTDSAEAAVDYTYKPKPEITHKFQEPTQRPSAFVSTTFTVLCLLPLVLLLVLWGKLGINVSNFPFSLSALGFHLGIGAIFGLFCFFWLQLNMFTTLRYLFMVGVFTFYCGNSMLSKIAAARKESSK
ncbi:dolichyl-diphosphooligosaccharide--protein glycosyltransferase subunit 2 isoform X2 [Hyalella azteca]|uniref:Dolichyl-diphosphooligosaccharide--protein glycosyltransferase subunit 2 n=1 Tax=Hyalella azteca TaxID=294128 RepID=A0A8B7PAR4_HYAAZ|nr:dolichyl-diphosphooligosaccharide--protein glycosyltransferase subunit 2 isoform X2 [Hyalella azteca]